MSDGPLILTSFAETWCEMWDHVFNKSTSEDFSLSENHFSGKTYYYTIASRRSLEAEDAAAAAAAGKTLYQVLVALKERER